MATPFAETPKWFDAEHYMSAKLAQLQAQDPAGEWTREKMNTAFVQNGCQNPYDHYLAYGDAEGNSPNALFNADEYLTAKVASLGSTWTKDMVLKAIQDSGLTLTQHYVKFGAAEGINPSKSFDQNKYFDAKLEQLMATDPKGEWTLDKVKEAFAANGISPLEHFMTYGKTEGLDDPKYDYSENGKPIPHPGNEKIELTTGTDTVGPDVADAAFKTSGRDDTISGVVSSITSKGTLNNTDVIDGAGGRDTLKLDMQGSFAGFKDGAGVKNVETIALENAGGYTFDAKGVVGAELYTANVGAKATTIKNVDTVATGVEFSAAASGSLTFQYTDAALAGKEDVASVTLKSVGDASGSASLTVGGATSTAKAETLALHSTGTSNNLKVTSSHDYIVAAGDAALTVVTTAAGLKGFDASAATGAVKADLTQSLATLKTIAGGEGKDTLQFKGMTADANIKAAISGFETMEFGLTSGGHTYTVDMANVTGLTAVDFKGVATADDAVILKGATQTELTLNVQDTVGGGTLNYDGAGTLNVASYGETASATTELDSIVAKAATALTITNGADDTSTLTLTALEARQAETVMLDAKTGAITIEATNTLSAMQTLEIKGAGDVSFRGSAVDTALTSVTAADLKGDLYLNLHAASTTKLASIEAGAGNDYIRVSTMASGGTIVGGDGADWIKGGSGNDIIYAGSASANGSDTLSDVNKVASLALNGNEDWSASGNHYLDTRGLAVLRDANILEGGAGNDQLYASNQKDVFLFQTGGYTAGHTQELTFKELGKDSIYGFEFGVDKLMLMDQDSYDDGGVYQDPRDFSAGWKFELGTSGSGTFKIPGTTSGNYTTHDFKITSSGPAATATSSNKGGITVSFESGNCVITIDADVLTNTTANTGAATGDDLTIKLVGVTYEQINDGYDLADLFGAIHGIA